MAGTGTKRAKIRKGDQVIVIAGRDNGKRGRVLEVLPMKNRVKVEGVAIMKKHQKANPQNNRGGGIIDKEAYIDISNVQLIDPDSGKPTRVRAGQSSEGVRQRIATKSGSVIEK
jgi:large subunit ribosomal protein L24